MWKKIVKEVVIVGFFAFAGTLVAYFFLKFSLREALPGALILSIILNYVFKCRT
jgi:hypothetical protein